MQLGVGAAQVRKGLDEYLDSKRHSFPRFYFLSEADLVSVLSTGVDLTRVQPLLGRMFEGVDSFECQDDSEVLSAPTNLCLATFDVLACGFFAGMNPKPQFGRLHIEGCSLQVTAALSPQGERLPLCRSFNPETYDGGVDKWLQECEGILRDSVLAMLRQSADAHAVNTDRTTWAVEWPAQAVSAVCGIAWTAEVCCLTCMYACSRAIFPLSSVALVDSVACGYSVGAYGIGRDIHLS